jgi:serine protease DegQ
MIVRTKDNIIQYMAMFRPGQRISVGVGRSGDTMSVDVVLDSMEIPFEQRDRLAKLRPHLGATVVVTSGVPMLSRVQRHGPSYHAGLDDGDKLLSINGQPIQNSDDAARIVAALQPGGIARIVCERRGTRTEHNVVIGAVVAASNK